MKRNIRIFAIALLTASLLLALALVGGAAEPYTVTVIAAPAGSFASFDDVPVALGENELFCGWYTSSGAASALNGQYVPEEPTETMYGAVLSLPEDCMAALGVQLYTKEPYGIRFVSRIDKQLLSAVEALNAQNRAGKNGTLMPLTEHKTGIGYGTVLAIESEIDARLEKIGGKFVSGGVCVPGVYTYAESDSALDYTATVLGIDLASYADDIAARPYLTYADANGVVRTLYFTEPGARTGAYAVSLCTLAETIEADADASDAAKAAANAVLSDYAADAAVSVTPISALNADSSPDSADGDNAYIELDRTTLRYLTQQNGDNYRYSKNAYYSRVLRVRDDFYLMFFQYGQFGVHLYYATSTDGINWGTPVVLYNATKNSLTYESGSLAGTTDSYYAVNADAVLLQNGEILVVYSRRANKGYALQEYTALNTIELVRMKVSADNKVTVSSPVSIYHGNSWEPEIIQRSNGRIEVYWSHSAPMLDIYGYQSEKRSSGVAMIVSTDNGYSWTPNVTANDTNHFAGKRIFQQFACVMPIDGKDVNFYSGQMPAVVEMSDGRLFLACEFEGLKRTTNESGEEVATKFFMISAAVSDENGEWRELGIDEEGPETRYESLFRGSAPAVCRFDSGELLLSYNITKMYTRLLKKDASDLADAYVLDIFKNVSSGDEKTIGCWSTVEVKNSHTALLSMAFPTYLGGGDASTVNDDGAIGIVHGRLNHTVNASRKNVVADGNPREWAKVNEALFVGSESAAQAAYRFAYDEKNVYICIDYIDESLADGDSLYVLLETADGTVTAQISADGVVAAQNGVTGGGKTAANGGVYEFSLDRAALGLTGSTLRVCPGFTKADGTADTIDGTTSDPATWLKVNLES